MRTIKEKHSQSPSTLSIIPPKRWFARIRRRHTLDSSVQAEQEKKNAMVHDYERLYYTIEEEVCIQRYAGIYLFVKKHRFSNSG